MQEGEVAGGFGLGEGEEVLGGQGGGLDHHRASGLAVGDQDFLGAADEFAVDGAVGDVEAHRLEAARVGEELERRGVALLEDQRAGLVAVGDARGSRVRGRVVDAHHGEVDCRNFAYGGVEGEGAAAAGGLVENAVVVEVDGGGAEGSAGGDVGDGGGRHDRLDHAARLQDGAEAGRRASGAGAGQLDLEREAHAAIGQQLGAVAQVGADEVAADQIGLNGRDVEVAHQQGIGADRGAVGAGGDFLLDEDQPLAGKCHGSLPRNVNGIDARLTRRVEAPIPTRFRRAGSCRLHPDTGGADAQERRCPIQPPRWARGSAFPPARANLRGPLIACVWVQATQRALQSHRQIAYGGAVQDAIGAEDYAYGSVSGL